MVVGLGRILEEVEMMEQQMGLGMMVRVRFRVMETSGNKIRRIMVHNRVGTTTIPLIWVWIMCSQRVEEILMDRTHMEPDKGNEEVFLMMKQTRK